jgi:hypothetical protein
MINKSVFENDLIAGMQRNLASKTQESAMNKLAKAVEFLNSAAEILDNANLTAQADRILAVLEKIAVGKVDLTPMIHALKAAGIDVMSPGYLESLTKNSAKRARFNLALYNAGFIYDDIRSFVGDRIAMSPDDKHLEMWTSVLDTNKSPVKKHERFVPETIKDFDHHIDVEEVSDINDAKKHKTLKDPHSHKLTIQKMIANLKNRGTMFNMADDNDIEDGNENHLMDLINQELEKSDQNNAEGSDKDPVFEDEII